MILFIKNVRMIQETFTLDFSGFTNRPMWLMQFVPLKPSFFVYEMIIILQNIVLNENSLSDLCTYRLHATK